jgi:ornithine carbamoyltransferase
MGSRTELLRNNDHEGLKKLEQQALAENAKHKKWEVNEAMVNLTKNKNALYMHPLPADISGLNCETGEVTNEIFERYRIETYKEAGWKPYIIAAMIFAGKFKNPAETLENILKRNQKRVF